MTKEGSLCQKVDCSQVEGKFTLLPPAINSWKLDPAKKAKCILMAPGIRKHKKDKKRKKMSM